MEGENLQAGWQDRRRGRTDDSDGGAGPPKRRQRKLTAVSKRRTRQMGGPRAKRDTSDNLGGRSKRTVKGSHPAGHPRDEDGIGRRTIGGFLVQTSGVGSGNQIGLFRES